MGMRDPCNRRDLVLCAGQEVSLGGALYIAKQTTRSGEVNELEEFSAPAEEPEERFDDEEPYEDVSDAEIVALLDKAKSRETDELPTNQYERMSDEQVGGLLDAAMGRPTALNDENDPDGSVRLQARLVGKQKEAFAQGVTDPVDLEAIGAGAMSVRLAVARAEALELVGSRPGLSMAEVQGMSDAEVIAKANEALGREPTFGMTKDQLAQYQRGGK